MKGFRFEDDEAQAPRIRFMALELIREEIIAHRERDEAYDEMVIVTVTDLATLRSGAYMIGAASSDIGSTVLLRSVYEGMLEVRHDGQDSFIQGGPDSLRLTAVSLVSGASDLSAQMLGGSVLSTVVDRPKDATVISEGYLANVVFSDLETAMFMGQETGGVDFVGSSVPLDMESPVYGLKSVEIPGHDNDEHTIPSDLALIIAATTASDEELGMLG